MGRSIPNKYCYSWPINPLNCWKFWHFWPWICVIVALKAYWVSKFRCFLRPKSWPRPRDSACLSIQYCQIWAFLLHKLGSYWNFDSNYLQNPRIFISKMFSKLKILIISPLFMNKGRSEHRKLKNNYCTPWDHCALYLKISIHFHVLVSIIKKWQKMNAVHGMLSTRLHSQKIVIKNFCIRYFDNSNDQIMK